MKWLQLTSVLLLSSAAVGIAIAEAAAQPSHPQNTAVEGAVYRESRFFEEGREMFEDEIQRLQQPAQDRQLLTLDDSIFFDPDTQEFYPTMDENDFEEFADPAE